MRQSLGAIIAVSLLGAGCASLQETKMYNGPFGRTEVGAVMIAADPASSKVLVETYDGDLWIYDVDASARGRLSGLRVGDEVVLAFDDRIAGKRAIAINVLAAGSRPLPPGMLSVADLLPAGVVLGAPAIPTYVAGGRVYGPGRVGIGPDGMVIAANGSSALVSGVVVPGLGGISGLSSGVVSPQVAIGLGLVPGAFVAAGPTSIVTTSPGGAFTQGNFTPGSIAPGVTTANPAAPGKPTVQGPFTPGAMTAGSQGGAALTTPSQGNFTPGTVAPGVRTTAPGTPGQPVTTQGPFTPGTVAPGVSTQQGNAPPPAAGSSTSGTGQPAPTQVAPASNGRPAVVGPGPASQPAGPAAATPRGGGAATPR
jgi:hypothetical protein